MVPGCSTVQCRACRLGATTLIGVAPDCAVVAESAEPDLPHEMGTSARKANHSGADATIWAESAEIYAEV